MNRCNISHTNKHTKHNYANLIEADYEGNVKQQQQQQQHSNDTKAKT